MDKIRVSQHSGRVGSASHNDRSFLKEMSAAEKSEKAAHIDESLMSQNEKWSWDGNTDNFKQSELDYYKKNYQAGIDRTNENYIRSRHSERCKKVEDYYNNSKTCPEEMILQIGDKSSDVSKEKFQACMWDYWQWFNEWNRSHGYPCQILNTALHTDETSIHIHIRRVWHYTDNQGLKRIGQNKALKAAGIPLPDPSKKEGRYNNRKMTFDMMARERWQEICRNHGFDIETEPRLNAKHKDKAEYIADQMAKEQHEQETALEMVRNDLSRAEKSLNDTISKSEEYKQALDTQFAKMGENASKLGKLEQAVDSAEDKAAQRQAFLASLPEEAQLHQIVESVKASADDYRNLVLESKDIEIYKKHPANRLTGRPETVEITSESFQKAQNALKSSEEVYKCHKLVKSLTEASEGLERNIRQLSKTQDQLFAEKEYVTLRAHEEEIAEFRRNNNNLSKQNQRLNKQLSKVQDKVSVYDDLNRTPFFQRIFTAVKRKLHLEKWFDEPDNWFKQIGRLWTVFEGREMLDSQFKMIYTEHCLNNDLTPREDMYYDKQHEKSHDEHEHDTQDYDDWDLSL